MKEFAAQNLKAALKDVLKQRKLRYEDLASELECSVPTVKRILGNEELTLTRLLEICEVLDLSLGDLEMLAKKEKPSSVAFTPEQEKFLARSPSHFAYLLKLYSGKSPKQIAQEHSLSARATEKHLIALEKHELIRVTGAQKVKPTYKQLPSLGNGELAERYYRGFVQTGADFFKAHIAESLATTGEEKPPGGFSLQSLKVSRETYVAWTEERAKSLAEFQRRAAFEEKTRSASELMTAVTVEGFALVANDHAGLESLDNTLGKIE